MTGTQLLARIAEARQCPPDRAGLEGIRTNVWALLSTGPLRKGGEWEPGEANLLGYCVLLLDQLLGEQPLPECWGDSVGK